MSTAQMDQAANLLSVERRTIQASVLPNIGTNKKISGAVINLGGGTDKLFLASTAATP